MTAATRARERCLSDGSECHTAVASHQQLLDVVLDQRGFPREQGSLRGRRRGQIEDGLSVTRLSVSVDRRALLHRLD